MKWIKEWWANFSPAISDILGGIIFLAFISVAAALVLIFSTGLFIAGSTCIVKFFKFFLE